MYTAVQILTIIVPLLYLITCWFYGRAFYRDDEFSSRHKTRFLAASVGAHFLWLMLRTAEFQAIPVTGIYQLCGVLGLTIALAYTLIETSTRVKNTGFFVLTLSALLVTLDALFTDYRYGVQDVLRSELLALHVISALVGYSAFWLSAIYSLLYLVLYKKLREKKFDTIYRNLPNLESLESMSGKGIYVGFFAMTFTILIGVIWLPRAFDDFSLTDAQLIGALITWLVYGVGILIAKMAHFRGRKIALLSMVGLAVTCVSIVFANVFTGFHKFH